MDMKYRGSVVYSVDLEEVLRVRLVTKAQITEIVPPFPHHLKVSYDPEVERGLASETGVA